MASGRRADQGTDGRWIAGGHAPVPTTAIFSRTDGICGVAGLHGKELRNVPKASRSRAAIAAWGHHPAAVYAVADRLAQPEGKWAPFDRSGWRSLVYPDPASDPNRGRGRPALV